MLNTSQRDNRGVQRGDVIDDRYELVRKIGRGAMGLVFEARHTTVGRRLAVKILSHEWAGDPGMKKRFRAEARAASAAGHPNIVDVVDAGELPDGRPYIVLEFLEGRDASEILAEQGRMSVRRACRVIRLAARALYAAHEVNIVHRDLKPENIFVVHPIGDAAEGVKVLDFGIAAMSDPTASRMTQAGLAVGTPHYMAPEQTCGERPTPSFDIYALGAVLFELLTGVPPIDADTPLTVIRLKMARDAPRLDELRPGLPVALVDLVAACLQRDPADRPASAAQVADALGRIEQDIEESSSTLEGPPERGPVRDGPAGRRLIGAAAVVALFAGTCAYMIAHPGESSSFTRGIEPLRRDEPMLAKAPVPSLVQLTYPESDEAPAAPEEAGVQTTRRGTARRDSVSRPRSDPPQPPPKSLKPATTSKAHDTVACQSSRKEADQARSAHDWSGVLRHTSARKCWARTAERLRLRVQALSELGRFSDCADQGGASRDPQVVRIVSLCRKRAQRARG